MSVVCARFTKEALIFSHDGGSDTIVVKYSDRPDIFGHPRFLFGDFDGCEVVVRDSLRKLRLKWRLFAPKVVVRIEKVLEGGVTEIDRRVIKDVFTFSGAREVLINEG